MTVTRRRLFQILGGGALGAAGLRLPAPAAVPARNLAEGLTISIAPIDAADFAAFIERSVAPVMLSALRDAGEAKAIARRRLMRFATVDQAEGAPVEPLQASAADPGYLADSERHIQIREIDQSERDTQGGEPPARRAGEDDPHAFKPGDRVAFTDEARRRFPIETRNRITFGTLREPATNDPRARLWIVDMDALGYGQVWHAEHFRPLDANATQPVQSE